MKANEAPEKIFISNFDIEALPKNEQLSDHWYEVSTQNTDIEYTRTDAFIEKAIGWIDYNNRNGGCNFDDWEKDFKNYIKGK